MNSIPKNPSIYIIYFAYYLGALTDGLALVPMLFPKIGSMLFGGDKSQISVSYRYAMGIGASLMFGWTILLIWGAQEPIKRRFVLLLTVFPVLIGLIFSNYYAIKSGFLEFDRVKYLYMHQCFLCILFVYSYIQARKLSKG